MPERRFVRGGEPPAPKPGVLLQVRAYELHGTPYFALLYRLDAEPSQAREARVSAEMIYAGPQAGDAVLVQSVLGVVDRVQRREGA